MEVLCKQLYETGNASVRAEAEKALVNFAASPDCLTKCQLLLDRGDVSHSQYSERNRPFIFREYIYVTFNNLYVCMHYSLLVQALLPVSALYRQRVNEFNNLKLRDRVACWASLIV